MYLKLFKLKELPFRLSPDPQFLYLSKGHARAKAYLESTIWFTDGFVVITGEIGSGKTTLIETLLAELDKTVVVAQINQTQLSATEFLQAVLVQFGFSPFQMKKAELLATLNKFLIEQYAAGHKVLLIVDEAQNLGLRVLEEIRMLSGVETTKEKVLRIILAGQPELNEKMDAPELAQLAQRVRLRFHLTALSPEEMRNYILHRLEVAGSQGREIFDPACFEIINRYAGGVPRLTNTLCDTAMLAAFNADRDHVLPADVEAAVEELQWVEFAVRGAVSDSTLTLRYKPSRRPEPLHENNLDTPLAHLLVVNQGRAVGEHALRVGRTIIGRAPEADLRIEGLGISRNHCLIITNERFCVIEDLNSTNGVQIEGKRIRVHNLNDGDVVTLGSHQLMYINERGVHHSVNEIDIAERDKSAQVEDPSRE